MTEAFIFIAVAYCLLDFVLGMVLGRCVLPGLRCHACKTPHGKHGSSNREGAVDRSQPKPHRHDAQRVTHLS